MKNVHVGKRYFFWDGNRICNGLCSINSNKDGNVVLINKSGKIYEVNKKDVFEHSEDTLKDK